MAAGKALGGPAERARPARFGRRRTLAPWRLIGPIARRLGWGVADQAMSSISNFAVNIYIARTLGVVPYGAFSLAYVTYSFALNASRGLATDPLMVRFSGTDLPAWRRAVADCTGAAVTVGLAAGACVLGATTLLSGTARLAFLALGLTLPGLLLQDSWRFSFFALGRGEHALINDTLWVVLLLPTLILLQMHGYANVFWFVLAWGATGAVAAAAGPMQARASPRLAGMSSWVSEHRDLGPRYLLEGTSNSASSQLRNYGIGLILGLAAVGSVQAAMTLMGPFMVIYFGMGLVTLPEAARLWRQSARRMVAFCALYSSGLAVASLLWGVALLIVLPHGLGLWLLHRLYQPAYPLILPFTLSIMGGCIGGGAGTGLHAIGAAKRSLRAMIISSALNVAGALGGAVADGTVGTVTGLAITTWIGTVVFWWQLRAALREAAGPSHAGPSDAGPGDAGPGDDGRTAAGRHRRPAAADGPQPDPA